MYESAILRYMHTKEFLPWLPEGACAGVDCNVIGSDQKLETT